MYGRAWPSARFLLAAPGDTVDNLINPAAPWLLPFFARPRFFCASSILFDRSSPSAPSQLPLRQLRFLRTRSLGDGCYLIECTGIFLDRLGLVAIGTHESYSGNAIT